MASLRRLHRLASKSGSCESQTAFRAALAPDFGRLRTTASAGKPLHPPPRLIYTAQGANLYGCGLRRQGAALVWERRSGARVYMRALPAVTASIDVVMRPRARAG